MDQEAAEIIEYEGEEGKIRLFMYDGGVQSAVRIEKERRNDLVFEYMIRFGQMSSLHPCAKDVLVIGAGMFSYPRWLVAHDPDVQIDALDPDEEMLDYACDYFWLDELIEEYHLNENDRLNFIADEGRSYLEHCDKQYDIIINDAFNGLEPVPDLCTQEAMETVKGRLKPGGMYLVNLPGYSDIAESDYLKSSIETMKQVFSHVVAVTAKGVLSGENGINYVVMASDTYDHFEGQLEIHTEGAAVFHDDDEETISESFDWI